MKIACQSCQAKYTIADEKVVGKVVKIRCKKCGSTIVVNGQEGSQAAAANEEATEVRAGSSADLNGGAADADAWTVNVGDNDQRTMTTHMVVAEFAKGTVNDETYCWRDGMGDWLPLREIEELAQACGLTAASEFARQAPPELAAPAARASSGSVRPAAAAAAGVMGGSAGLFGTSPIPSGVQAAPIPAAARRANGRAGGADLFGGAAEAGGENDVMTSAPQSMSGARVAEGDGKMTGQRNENSVLFSLNALTSAESQKGPKGGGLTGAAEGDGSGLIDIRALSSAMGSSGPKKATSHADDIMNLGGGGAFSAALAAPVLTAAPMDSGDAGPASAASNKKLYIMFGGLAFLLIAGMVGIYVALKPAAAPVAAAPDGSGTGAIPASPGTATAAPPAVAAPTPSAAPTPDPAAVVAATGDPAAKAPNVGVRRSGGGGAVGGGGGAAAPQNNPPPPPPPPAAPVGGGGGGGGGGGSLESLMARSAGGAPPPANAGAGGGGGGSTAPFDRGAAQAALGAIADSVGSCKKPGGPTGEGHVSITFSPGGSVVSAIVDEPPYAGTAVGGCVAGKFRGAHVPAFAGTNLKIGKRFTIN